MINIISRERLNIANVNIPAELSVVIDTIEIGTANHQKVFQVALTSELEENSIEVMTYLVNWDEQTNAIIPFNGFVWDENGLLRKNIFPPVYLKQKSQLTLIE